MSKPDRTVTRRRVLGTAAAGVVGAVVSRVIAKPQAADIDDLKLVGEFPEKLNRTWIGPQFWANRLQDWQLKEGKIECVARADGTSACTVALLTHEIIVGAKAASAGVRATMLEAGNGLLFCGFLIGIGEGQLDYRAAALAQKASGAGGGILCAYQSDGTCAFRDHTSEERPQAFEEMRSEKSGEPVRHRVGDEILLRLDVAPEAEGKFSLTLAAFNASGKSLSQAKLDGIAEKQLLGGFSIVSHGGRYAFHDIRASGEKFAVHPERTLGPIVGAMHSLNGSVLKLNAQLMPIGDSQPREVKLRAGGKELSAKIEPGFTALFRIENWDSSRDQEYELAYESQSYKGTIRKDPKDKTDLTIALFSCSAAAARTLDGGPGKPQLPQARLLGRYTHDNIYMPYREVTSHSSHHQPDLLVFAGDQLYESSPTARDISVNPALDYLYKWLIWLWSFAEMTRSTPTILMTDDHDVYHGNLWGNGGRAAPERDANRGGYRCSSDFVNLVTRTQCSHNPDPFDPTPIDQGISVYYGSFHFGGVSFAVLEDRKFKTAPEQGNDLDVHEAELLGERQEKFLAAWAKDRDEKSIKICLTQTVFGCVQTSPAGKPLVDFDSNGYPKPGRDKALSLLREAGALVLAGDQHLASIVRHGIDKHGDAVVQFAGPAVGTSWQRWFEPADKLPNALEQPFTGDFIDGFGNKFTVLAIANPSITFAEYRKHVKGRPQGLGDRKLKADGYGIVRVDKAKREFVIECWPWDADPAKNGRQYPGWPYRLPFANVRSL